MVIDVMKDVEINAKEEYVEHMVNMRIAEG